MELNPGARAMELINALNPPNQPMTLVINKEKMSISSPLSLFVQRSSVLGPDLTRFSARFLPGFEAS